MARIAASDFTPRIVRDRKLHNGFTVVARPETFPERLRRLRRAKGWSLRELGKRADTGTSTISEVENAKHDIAVGVAARLAIALGVPLCELWTGTPCGGTS